MKLLVTAGNTQTPLDQVRCITNIFTGKTGARIAVAAAERGHAVVLLTSHPEALAPFHAGPLPRGIASQGYRTFDDLKAALESQVRGGGFDAIVHAAAVSDYGMAGTYAPPPEARFDAEQKLWPQPTRFTDAAAGKVKSDHAELWLRLKPTQKLVDLIRAEWGFTGLLVKFKLEVGMEEAELEVVAEKSRRHSSAELMVANTLEGKDSWALMGPFDGHYQKVTRAELASHLLTELERLAAAKKTLAEGTSGALS